MIWLRRNWGGVASPSDNLLERLPRHVTSSDWYHMAGRSLKLKEKGKLMS